MNYFKRAVPRCCIFNGVAAQESTFTCRLCHQAWNRIDGEWRPVECEFPGAPEARLVSDRPVAPVYSFDGDGHPDFAAVEVAADHR